MSYSLKIEKEVLKNYLISSPSKLPLENKKFRKKFFADKEKLFLEHLKLPKKLFLNADMLDIGSGTGEHDICYAKWGANLTLLDINPTSNRQAKKYFKIFKVKNKLKKIINTSLYNFKTKKKFDIIISEGVIHHVQEPKKVFKILTKNLKPGGFCILALGFDTSHLQRSLQRLIMHELCKKASIEENEKIIKHLFSETINRAHKFGQRSKKQIIHDFYHNPKHTGINLVEILSWLHKDKMQYYSSYPSIEPEGYMNGLTQKSIGEYLKEEPLITLFQSIYFLLASKDYKETFKKYSLEARKVNKNWKNFLIESKLNDIDNKTSNLNFTKIVKKFNSFMNSNVILFNKRNNDITKKIINFNKEFQKLLKSIEKRDLKLMKKNIKNFSHLFNGYNGVPSNYIVGYKK